MTEKNNSMLRTKICKQCNLELPISDFSVKGNGKGYYSHICKNCVSKYYERNRERENNRVREWRKNNPEKLNNYYQINKKEIMKRIKKYAQETVKELKKEIFELLGGKCINPYNIDHGAFLSNQRCLQIDHVNGNGTKERDKFGGFQYYKHILGKLKSGFKDYQLLCANCNWIKKQEKNEVRKK